MNDIIMEKAYNPVDTEKNWYETWKENDLFKAENDSEKPPFSMILPPPNVTGVLHMGHALTFTIPDIIIRRKKMQGFNTLWLPGLDHAGIATQMVVEKNLKKEKDLTKEDIGREKFLELVWDWKKKSEHTIVEQISKLGLCLDWSRKKFTLSDEMKKVVSKVFVQLYKEGEIYQGTYMVNGCPSCKTVLSDLEVEHKEVKGKLTHIKYPYAKNKDKYIIVATTRPETMLGDVAVAVNPDDERYKELVGEELELPLT
ncbi:MAG: class I tRNA ligase family protein, partial [bacterium]|nr:class I tRNA ligase family protein [bacterium]